MSNTERRTFLKSAGAGALALSVGQQSLRAADANNKLIVGVIGTGGMGSNHVRTLAKRKDVEIAYVCDVDKRRLAAAVESVSSIAGNTPKAVDDLRNLLDAREVDAVFIATPDHWHVPAALLAMDAGKHVYVEKPCSHNIREGQLLVKKAGQSGKVLQVGTQSRSAPFLKEAIQRVHEGEIGEVLVAKAWNSQRRGSIGKKMPSKPPEYLNFDRWVGPAPMVAYRTNLLPSIWRWWRDFGCGDIGNDGVHDIDVALWGLGMNSHPFRVSCLGGKSFFDDDQQFPDTQYSVCEYSSNNSSGGKTKRLIFEQRTWSPYTQEGYENGAAFYGTEGIMLLGHTRGWKLFGKRNKLIAEAKGRPILDDHYDNFFACIRGNEKQPAASAAIGHFAATICHLSNISARVGRVLNYDPRNETISGDEQASQQLRRQYRESHWAIPGDV